MTFLRFLLKAIIRIVRLIPTDIETSNFADSLAGVQNVHIERNAELINVRELHSECKRMIIKVFGIHPKN
jgi:hypothetical protein